MPLLSVIMPAYNAAAYIEIAIDSVLSQSFKDFELIVVNDGSADNTLDIINSYKDERLKVYTKPNSGPADTRNWGIERSSGEFIMFIDSDDSFSEGAFETIARHCGEGSFDMLIFGFVQHNVETGSSFKYFLPDMEAAVKQDLKDKFGDLYVSNLLNSVWNKVFRAETLKENSIKFCDYLYGEDRLFVFDFLRHCDRIKVISDCLYNYIMMNKNSLVSRYYDKKFEACCAINKAIYALQEVTGSFSEETLNNIRYMFLKSVISCITNIYHPSCKKTASEKRGELKEIINHSDVVNALTEYKSSDIVMDMLVIILKSKSIPLISMASKGIIFTSKNLSAPFVKLKNYKILKSRAE